MAESTTIQPSEFFKEFRGELLDYKTMNKDSQLVKINVKLFNKHEYKSTTRL